MFDTTEAPEAFDRQAHVPKSKRKICFFLFLLYDCRLINCLDIQLFHRQ
jgi:hypothetical protein